MIGDEHRLLSRPPPRPLRAVAGGEAFLGAVAGVVGCVLGISLFLSTLALQVLPRIRTPILGDTVATVSVLACFAGAALFVGSWIVGASSLRRVHLYRTGQRGTGTVERVSVKGDGEIKRATVHWRLRAQGGEAYSMRTQLRLPRGVETVPALSSGVQFPALYPEGRPGAARPAGLLRLRGDWKLAPSVQPPPGHLAFRSAAMVAAMVLMILAVTGMTVNRTLDPGFLKSWTWPIAGSAAVLCLPLWLALRRHGPWLPGQPWLWLALGFFALSMGGMGAVSGANVWLDDGEPRIVRTEVLHMDEEYFPEWHFAAYVRSWREGRVKERVPLYWRTSLSVGPGTELLVEVRDGALGWPTVGRVSVAY